jgi:hypothetical protein
MLADRALGPERATVRRGGPDLRGGRRVPPSLTASGPR